MSDRESVCAHLRLVVKFICIALFTAALQKIMMFMFIIYSCLIAAFIRLKLDDGHI